MRTDQCETERHPLKCGPSCPPQAWENAILKQNYPCVYSDAYSYWCNLINDPLTVIVIITAIAAIAASFFFWTQLDRFGYPGCSGFWNYAHSCFDLHSGIWNLYFNLVVAVMLAGVMAVTALGLFVVTGTFQFYSFGLDVQAIQDAVNLTYPDTIPFRRSTSPCDAAMRCVSTTDVLYTPDDGRRRFYQIIAALAMLHTIEDVIDATSWPDRSWLYQWRQWLADPFVREVYVMSRCSLDNTAVHFIDRYVLWCRDADCCCANKAPCEKAAASAPGAWGLGYGGYGRAGSCIDMLCGGSNNGDGPDPYPRASAWLNVITRFSVWGTFFAYFIAFVYAWIVASWPWVIANGTWWGSDSLTANATFGSDNGSCMSGLCHSDLQAKKAAMMSATTTPTTPATMNTNNNNNELVSMLASAFAQVAASQMSAVSASVAASVAASVSASVSANLTLGAHQGSLSAPLVMKLAQAFAAVASSAVAATSSPSSFLLPDNSNNNDNDAFRQSSTGSSAAHSAGLHDSVEFRREWWNTFVGTISQLFTVLSLMFVAYQVIVSNISNELTIKRDAANNIFSSLISAWPYSLQSAKEYFPYLKPLWDTVWFPASTVLDVNAQRYVTIEAQKAYLLWIEAQIYSSSFPSPSRVWLWQHMFQRSPTLRLLYQSTRYTYNENMRKFIHDYVTRLGPTHEDCAPTTKQEVCCDAGVLADILNPCLPVTAYTIVPTIGATCPSSASSACGSCCSDCASSSSGCAIQETGVAGTASIAATSVGGNNINAAGGGAENNGIGVVGVASVDTANGTAASGGTISVDTASGGATCAFQSGAFQSGACQSGALQTSVSSGVSVGVNSGTNVATVVASSVNKCRSEQPTH